MPTTINNSLNSISNSYVERQTEENAGLGQDAFLKMLIAQLQNQDPLNPMEGTDFTAQLSQFSSLEQQFEMNDNLENIMNSLQANSDNNNYLDYIGKEVLGKMDSISLSDNTASGGYFTIDEPADIQVSIYDSNAIEVRQLFLGVEPAGTHEIIWNGNDSNGEPLPDGTYTFDVTATNENGTSYQAGATISGLVSGVTYENTKPFLVIDNILVNPDSVTDIRLVENNEPT